MTAIPRLDPLAVRIQTGAGLHGTRLSPLPLRMIEPQLDLASQGRARRTRIWELSNHLHCSIVGTCLSTAELRQVVAKTGPAADGSSEHDLHHRGVTLAGQRDGAAKLLHKALDRKHRAAIARFDKAGTVDEVRTEWREAVKRGDIPGGYWAAMTHPAASDALVREVFGEVHMLSHLVGAANRADIRKLAELEAENDRLRAKLARQQDQLRDGLTRRDARIQELNDLLARRIGEEAAAGQPDDASERAALEGLVASLEQRLRSEGNRRIAVEERLARRTEELAREREQHAASRHQEAVLREELEAIEPDIASQAAEGEASPASLAGLSLLYVGGRTDRLGHLRTLSEQRGVTFLHHDGGVDDRSGLLAGLVSRADVVMFPVDCVSHEAVTIVKRLCRQTAKRYVPLRSSGTSSYVAALARSAGERTDRHQASI
ncbi:DUF2325 domain-containing protein [Reyranella soli]|uniref:DUF2325 domain-containing protein n=1 Tax=Reyranella soli TaxID=1230389 RepID=UPI0011BE5FFD|nr:DUF2325 domain-containing protein [Reyranella soli]